jgi:hypothetical protein
MGLNVRYAHAKRGSTHIERLRVEAANQKSLPCTWWVWKRQSVPWSLALFSARSAAQETCKGALGRD